MYLVYQVTGKDRLTTQLIRIVIESLLFLVLITGESKIALFLLVGFNMFSGIVAYSRIDSDNIYLLFTIIHFTTKNTKQRV